MILEGKTGHYNVKATKKKPRRIFAAAFRGAGLGMSNLSCFNSVFLECHFSVNPIFWL